MSDTTQKPVLWAVFRVWPFSAMTANGIRVRVDHGEPTRFIPVFETREQAVKWYGKDDESIQPITVGSCLARLGGDA